MKCYTKHWEAYNNNKSITHTHKQWCITTLQEKWHQERYLIQSGKVFTNIDRYTRLRSWFLIIFALSHLSYKAMNWFFAMLTIQHWNVSLKFWQSSIFLVALSLYSEEEKNTKIPSTKSTYKQENEAFLDGRM